MRYLVIVLAVVLVLAVAGCDRTATPVTMVTAAVPTGQAAAPNGQAAAPTGQAAAPQMTTTTIREAYKEAWNTLGLTVRVEQLLAIAETLGGSDYPDVDALGAWIEAQQQALEDLLPAHPSLEYRRVHEAMMAGFEDLLTACPYKERYDADRDDLEAYAALQGLTRGALIRLLSVEEELSLLLAAIDHNPVDIGSAAQE